MEPCSAEKEMKKWGVIRSMTMEERKKPDILKVISKRIAKR